MTWTDLKLLLERILDVSSWDELLAPTLTCSA